MNTRTEHPSRPNTEAAIRALTAPDRDVVIPMGDCLHLRVRRSGKKTFLIRRRVGGKWQVTTLGDWPQWSLQRARAAALAPSEQPAVKLTFGKSTEAFCKEVIEAKYRTEEGAKEAARYFTRDGVRLTSIRLANLTRGQLIDAIKAKSKTAANGSRKMLALYKQWSKWAVLHDHMTTDLLGVVTVSNIGLPVAKSRERVLTPDELKWVMTGDTADHPILRFCLATACRVGEALAMSPEQVDSSVWTIPVTKNGRPHRVWLTDFAKRQLPLPKAVYISLHGRLRRAGVEWNLHDLRRTAATTMRAAGVSVEDVEAVLNHTPRGGLLIRTYQRHDPMPAVQRALEALEVALKKI
jgi:integrase